MARLLRGLGHEVTTAGTIAAALESVEASDFDLIISDIGLPDGSGLELMRQVVARRGPVPAIALTGYGMEEDIRGSREAGLHRPHDQADRLHQARGDDPAGRPSAGRSRLRAVARRPVGTADQTDRRATRILTTSIRSKSPTIAASRFSGPRRPRRSQRANATSIRSGGNTRKSRFKTSNDEDDRGRHRDQRTQVFKDPTRLMASVLPP